MNTSLTKQSLLPIVRLLQYTFIVVPVVAGADKFMDLLTHWGQYLPHFMEGIVPAPLLMKVVGVIEIGAGILVWKKPAIGGLIVAAWLVLIAVTLLTGFFYLDVAVRDLVMAVAAFSMARLSKLVA